MWEQEGKQSVGRKETKAFGQRSSHEKVRRRPAGVRKLCSVCLRMCMGVSQHVATSETHAGWQDAGLLCMLSSPMALIKYSYQKQLRGGEGLLQLTGHYLSLNRSLDRN